MFSLKKTLLATVLLTAAVLIVIFFLALRQSFLAGRYDSLISQSEKLFFQFATIREHVTESMLEGQYRQLAKTAAEVETLNADLSRLLESSLIPGEYKLTLINQVDLAGIALLLRKIESDSGSQELVRQLNTDIRVLGDRLMRFDRVIVGQAKSSLVRLQNTVIGALAVVLCVFSFLLIVWYRRLALPLISLVRQTGNGELGERGLVYEEQACYEVQALADEVNILADRFLNLKADIAALFKISADILFFVSSEGVILDANPAARRALDLGPEVRGRNLNEVLFKDISLPAAKGLWAAVKKGRSASLIVEFDTLQGEYDVSLLVAGEPGEEITRLLFAARPRKEDAGLPVLSTRMCAVAAVGELSVGVAHEINNLINGVINYAQILLDEGEQQGLENGKLEPLRRIIADGERIAAVVRQIIFLTGAPGDIEKNLPMENVINAALSLIDQQLKNDGITTRISFPEKLPSVRVNPALMQQVFLNLFNNARYALNRRYPGRDDNKRLEINGELVFAEGGRGWLRTTVKDWGEGVEPEVLPMLVDPMFSTRPPGEGTGLGLTISKAIVEEYSGRLTIESVHNDHTTVKVDLPVKPDVLQPFTSYWPAR